MAPTAVFVTYTMLEPVVGGAFFRALRLACELARRGWQAEICNRGPLLSDPKVDQAPATVRIRSLDADLGITWHVEADPEAVRDYFSALDPAVVVMGETPFAVMQNYYEGAAAVDAPLVVLDQFYSPLLMPDPGDADLLLLYGLRSFWRDISLPTGCVMVPPFVEAVTPRAELPVPAGLHDRPWVLLVAYETPVLQRGVDLLARVTDLDATFITVSPDPAIARELLQAADIDPARCAALPVLPDVDVFGLMHASRITLVSNGFLQIMEALAVASPVIALERGAGVGMQELNIDHRFWPYVSFQESPKRQVQRVRDWYAQDPFSDELSAALRRERRGTARSADLIEDLVAHPEKYVRHRSRLRAVWERIGKLTQRSGG
jgi:hypothetical protein